MTINAKTPTFVMLTNVLIIALVVAVVCLTGNPLSMLGLFFLQNIPVFQSAIDDYDDEDEATAPGDDYAGTKVGFTKDK